MNMLMGISIELEFAYVFALIVYHVCMSISINIQILYYIFVGVHSQMIEKETDALSLASVGLRYFRAA